MGGEGGGASSTIGTNFFLALFGDPDTAQVHMNIYPCRVTFWTSGGGSVVETSPQRRRREGLKPGVSVANSGIGDAAEGVGFEPTRACALPVFKTGAINHSTTPPSSRGRENCATHLDAGKPSIGTQAESLCSVSDLERFPVHNHIRRHRPNQSGSHYVRQIMRRHIHS
jgi:hypothetical protein